MVVHPRILPSSPHYYTRHSHVVDDSTDAQSTFDVPSSLSQPTYGYVLAHFRLLTALFFLVLALLFLSRLRIMMLLFILNGNL